jgi:hypothetical protein
MLFESFTGLTVKDFDDVMIKRWQKDTSSMRSSGYPKRKKTKLCLIYGTMVIEINNFPDTINIITKKNLRTNIY